MVLAMAMSVAANDCTGDPLPQSYGGNCADVPQSECDGRYYQAPAMGGGVVFPCDWSESECIGDPLNACDAHSGEPVVCGDGLMVDSECEYPSTVNSIYCIQSTTVCNGLQRGLRDNKGDCNGTCECVEDVVDFECKAGFCDAECEFDADCPGDDVCNQNTCACEAVAECTVDGDCDDLVGCTDDTCVAESCVYTPVNANCDNGDWCDGAETCDGTGTCNPGTNIDCSPLNDECVVGICNETADQCESEPANEDGACDTGAGPGTCQSGVCEATGGGTPEFGSTTAILGILALVVVVAIVVMRKK